MKIQSRYILSIIGIPLLSLVTACSFVGQQPIIAEPTACECPDFIAPLSDTVVTVKESRPCPVIETPKVIKQVSVPKPVVIPAAPPTELQIVGLVENVTVSGINITLKAKFDTGAKFTSINAQDLKKFERDGKKWARFAVLHPDSGKKIYYELPVVRTKVIKQLSGKYQERPVVLLTLQVGSVKEPVEVTLSDRSGYLYQLLIGRNFMENRMLVDMGKTFQVK